MGQQETDCVLSKIINQKIKIYPGVSRNVYLVYPQVYIVNR